MHTIYIYKGIFRVQSLHLGHVAKSFGLRSNPSAIKTKHDVIGEIANGMLCSMECSVFISVLLIIVILCI